MSNLNITIECLLIEIVTINQYNIVCNNTKHNDNNNNLFSRIPGEAPNFPKIS